jgi:hypothetical protein
MRLHDDAAMHSIAIAFQAYLGVKFSMTRQRHRVSSLLLGTRMSAPHGTYSRIRRNGTVSLMRCLRALSQKGIASISVHSLEEKALRATRWISTPAVCFLTSDHSCIRNSQLQVVKSVLERGIHRRKLICRNLCFWLASRFAAPKTRAKQF